MKDIKQELNEYIKKEPGLYNNNPELYVELTTLMLKDREYMKQFFNNQDKLDADTPAEE